MQTLYQALRWREHPIPGGASVGQLVIKSGEVGSNGPRATLLAGVHGDEGPWGALAVRLLLERSTDTLSGSLRIVFSANPAATEADARNSPLDVLDLNRSFPGAISGSSTQRLAAQLAPLVADSDIVIDLHGGGSWCVNAFVFRFEGSEHLATDIGAPFLLDAPEKEGTLSQHARAHGAQVVAVEMGGCSSAELLWRDRITEGLERVLHNLGVLTLSPPPNPPPTSVEVGSSKVLVPNVGGIFLPTIREETVGTVVSGGTELGKVLDLHTLEVRETFIAPFSETALLLARPHIGVIEGGAMTYVVAEPK